MKTWKRDNWKNEEVIRLIEGQKLLNSSGEEDEYCKRWNEVVDSIAEQFQDFMRPVEEFGAMAYCVEDEVVYHVGKIPDEK